MHQVKEVIRVESSDNGIMAITRDGSYYEGDLIVGADGIHSKVRSEMWRLADARRPGHISTREKNSQSEFLGFSIYLLL